MKKHYIVVTADIGRFTARETGVQALSDRVNEKIKEGFLPIGGVSATASACTIHGDYTIHFYQAMMKG